MHMTRYCPACGHENTDDALACVSCGKDLSSLMQKPYAKKTSSAAEIEGVGFLRNYSIIGIISVAVALVIGFATLGILEWSGLVGPLGLAFGGATPTASNISNYLFYSEIDSLLGLVISLVGLYFLLKGFSVFQAVGDEFSTGRTGTILEIIGLIFVVVFLAGLIATILPLLQSFTSGGTPPATFFGGLILLTIGLLIGAVLLLIGLIMVTIGLFRVGSKYDSALVQVGCILVIFFGVVGYILLYVGFTGILRNLRDLTNASTS